MGPILSCLTDANYYRAVSVPVRSIVVTLEIPARRKERSRQISLRSSSCDLPPSA